MWFTFQAGTRILFGVDTVNALGEEVVQLNARRALIVTDSGLVAAGLLDRVTRPLQAAGVEIAVFDEIEPNPKDTTISAGAQSARESGADVIVGLGGGSPMDAAKAVAVMSANDGPLADYCERLDAWPNKPPPVVCVPTTAGTGSEVSRAAMINLEGQGLKQALFGPSIQPAVAVVDPCLTLGLPPRLTALTGIDALCHAAEAYIAKYANPITDALAEKAIELIAGSLREAYQRGDNLDARSNMLLASTIAILAAASAGLGVVHSMAQTLGGYYDVPHGLGIAVCFPIGIGYNVAVAPEKCARVAQLLGVGTDRMSQDEAALSVVDALRDLNAELHIDYDLRSYGLTAADIPELSAVCMEDGSTPTNPRPIAEADFSELLAQVLDEVTSDV